MWVGLRADRRSVALANIEIGGQRVQLQEDSMDVRKLGAEAIGTFWLTFGGCGSAVIASAFPQVGIGLARGIACLRTDGAHHGLFHRAHLGLPSQSSCYARVGRRWSLPGKGHRALCRCAGRRSDHCCGRSIHHCERRAGLRCRQRFCSQRLRGAFTRQVLFVRRVPRRGGPDDDVLVHHHGCHARQSPGRVCAHCDRAWLDPHPSRWNSHHEYLGQSSAQHRACPHSSADGRWRSSGSSGSHP